MSFDDEVVTRMIKLADDEMYKNKELKKSKSAEYRVNNKEYIKSYKKEYYKKNKEFINDKNKEYNKKIL